MRRRTSGDPSVRPVGEGTGPRSERLLIVASSRRNNITISQKGTCSGCHEHGSDEAGVTFVTDLLFSSFVLKMPLRGNLVVGQ